MQTTVTPPSGQIDVDDQNGLSAWCEYFGATVQQLLEAVQAVGSNPAKVQEHLLNQGASAGPG